MDPEALNFDSEAKVYDGSCEYTELNTQLILSFGMTAEGEHVAIDELFNDGHNHKVMVTKFQFYLSNLELLDGNSSSTLASAALIDLDTGVVENPDAPRWFNTVSFNVSPGSYSGIGFDIGVRPDLNRIDPTTYDAEQALSITPNMYWGWQSMYIFVKIEGEYDRDGDGEVETPFFFHTGLDELFIDLPLFSTNFEIVDRQKKRVDFVVDVKKLFTNLNLDEHYQSHTVIEDPMTGGLSADTASVEFTKSLEKAIALE